MKMTRRLKTLEFALVAVLAVGAVAASVASAAIDAFVSESAPVRVTGTQHNGNGKFILAGQAVECLTVDGAETINQTTVTEHTTAEVPTFSGCTYGGQAVTINMNGCGYVGTGTTNANGHLGVALECPGANRVELTLNAIKCLITIASQEAVGGYTATTTGAGSTTELTAHVTLKTNVTSQPHGSPSHGVVCASLTNGTGVQEGTATATGENLAGTQHIGITDEIVSAP